MIKSLASRTVFLINQRNKIIVLSSIDPTQNFFLQIKYVPMPKWLKTKVTKLQLKNNCKELKNNYYWLWIPKIKKRLVSESARVRRESTDLNGKFNLLFEWGKGYSFLVFTQKIRTRNSYLERKTMNCIIKGYDYLSR